MNKPMQKMLIGVTIFFTLIFGWYGAKKVLFFWFMSRYQPPIATISASPVEKVTWQSYLTAIGTLAAVNGVDLSTEVPGVIKEIRFSSGQNVKQGDVLFVLDNGIESAELKNSEAKLTLAKMNYEREKTLLTKKAASRASFDTHYAELEQATANVESAKNPA